MKFLATLLLALTSCTSYKPNQCWSSEDSKQLAWITNIHDYSEGSREIEYFYVDNSEWLPATGSNTRKESNGNTVYLFLFGDLYTKQVDHGRCVSEIRAADLRIELENMRGHVGELEYQVDRLNRKYNAQAGVLLRLTNEGHPNTSAGK